MLPAVLDVGVGGEVEHKVGAFHGGRERGQIEVVAADQLEFRMRQGAVEETDLPGGKVVPAGDLDAVREEAVGEIGANETGDAGDENVVERHERKAGNQTARGEGRGLSERPLQRLQKTNGTLSGKKLRASIVKYGSSSARISWGRLMCSRPINSL